MSRTQSKLQVKNRQPAPIQITAEQILREAHDRAGGDLSLGKTSRTQNLQRARITDPEELREYRTSRRKHFEDAIRSNRMGLGTYVKYAQWEEAQEEFERARSVWERALAIDHRAPSLWAKYAEMEMKNKFVNHARNVWDRAVSLLPRVDSLWYKYTHMEEMLENFAVARTVWDRWMKWEPEEAAWFSYVRFEERRGEVQKARTVWDRFLSVFPTVRSYLKVAKWEERQRQPTLARTIYERAFAELGDWEMSSGDKANLYSSFASFEERHGEIDRARAVFQYALNNLDDDQDDDDQVSAKLKDTYLAFEKKHGQVEAVERHVFQKRREAYEARVAAEPADYDAWFDLCKLEEDAVGLVAEEEEERTTFAATAAESSINSNSSSRGDKESRFDAVRDAYERAVAQVPPTKSPPKKQPWRRYVYLWICYAFFEELAAKDLDRARAVYRAALDLVMRESRKHFAFAKLWLYAAQLEVRRRDLPAARSLLGEALYACRNLGKTKLYLGYVHLERQLGEVDRCRAVFSKLVTDCPSKVRAFTEFADFERDVGEYARARAIYDLGIDQPVLDKPDLLWKAYIDFEIGLEKRKRKQQKKSHHHPPGSTDALDDDLLDDDDDLLDDEELDDGRRRVSDLYERLLEKSKHAKVWISYAKYELDSESTERARAIFQRADDFLKHDGTKDERALLLDTWLAAETTLLRAGDELDGGVDDAQQKNVAAVEAKMPRKIKKRRPRPDDESVYEDYVDYVFPDDQRAPLNLKLLEAARKWKAEQLKAQAAEQEAKVDDDDVEENGTHKRPRLADDFL